MTLAFIIGIGTMLILLGCLIWSHLYPERRVWPPIHSTGSFKGVVWFLTLVYFGATTFLGIADWNGLQWHALIRWGIGLPLIVIGNIVVWNGVFTIGFAATSGDRDQLVTDRLYAYSRNPQYLADAGILLGWGVLSASSWVLPLVAMGIVALFAAPYVEEEWLEDVYGHLYVRYKTTTPRFL